MHEATVGLNGVHLYTRRVGDGPAVIVLHGGPGAHHDYLVPQSERLALGRTLLYYDERGGGRSPVSRETPVGWREHVADLEALRQRWGLERVTLLGYSWGGLLAVLYALTHPDRVSRLALVSAAPLTAAWRDEFERRPPAPIAQPWPARSRKCGRASARTTCGPRSAGCSRTARRRARCWCTAYTTRCRSSRPARPRACWARGSSSSPPATRPTSRRPSSSSGRSTGSCRRPEADDQGPPPTPSFRPS